MALAIQEIAAIATPLSVLVLAIQLWQRQKQFTTDFEDKLTDQYREIATEIPVDALLDDSNSFRVRGDLKQYYRYIDLSNEQIFLRKEGRVSKSTWENWAAGIDSHLRRSDFNSAWQEISKRDPRSFHELRKYLDDDYADDPRYWDHPIRARMETAWYWVWNWKDFYNLVIKR
jgi:hypothetical protein